MSDSFDDFDSHLAARLRAHAALPRFDRNGEAVARAVMDWRGRRRGPVRGYLVATAVAIAIAAAVGAGIVAYTRPGSPASDALTANVAGADYRASVPYELSLVAPAQPYGEIASDDPRLDGQPALQLENIDPRAALVMPVRRNSYRILWGPRESDAFPGICPYLPADQRAVLDGCRA